MKKIILLAAFLFCIQGNAIHIAVVNHTPNMSYQDKDGEKSFYHSNIGLSFGIDLFDFWGHSFSPEVGYIFHGQTDDSFGEHTKRTLYLLYDLSYALTDNFKIRYGLSNFMTKISGDGKEVSVPNSTGAATGFQPSETVTSYTSAINFGLEYISGFQFLSITSVGIRFEGHLFTFLSSEKRSFGHTLNFNFYF